uniref:Eukaryotic translation initiation factor 3 subunit E n=1 Tax=Triatoma dimidiata TaxID=72491 RepID=A0A0V0G6R7_TRIDM
MEKFDLTPLLVPYLDRHLVLPLMEFLAAKEIYNKNDILQAKMDILSKTYMLDYFIDIITALYPGKNLDEVYERRAEILDQLITLKEANKDILELLTNDQVMANISGMREGPKGLVAYLTKEYDFKIESIDRFYTLSKFMYECGNYTFATSHLYFCLLVMPPTDKNYLNVLWGKLASEILTQGWESALDDLNKLKEYIDANTNSSSLQSLQHRTWLIHWSLFIFFNHGKGRDLIIDMFLYKPNYLNAIQTMCPHILRYLAAAVILNKQRRSALRDVVKVIQQESYTYRDPITEFLEHLYVNFDFEGARQKLHECQVVVFNDFFLVACLEDFVENARLMIFETFCRIHQCISIGMLAEKLNMNPDEAECWIVNLIRNARLDAKIDSKLAHFVMRTQPMSPYQQLLEKVDSLSVKSEALQALIERKVKARTQDPRWGQDYNN